MNPYCVHNMDSFLDQPRTIPRPIPVSQDLKAPVVPEASLIFQTCQKDMINSVMPRTPKPVSQQSYNAWKLRNSPHAVYDSFVVENKLSAGKENENKMCQNYVNYQYAFNKTRVLSENTRNIAPPTDISLLNKKQVRFESPVTVKPPTVLVQSPDFLRLLGKTTDQIESKVSEKINQKENKINSGTALKPPIIPPSVSGGKSFEKMYAANIPQTQPSSNIYETYKHSIKPNKPLSPEERFEKSTLSSIKYKNMGITATLSDFSKSAATHFELPDSGLLSHVRENKMIKNMNKIVHNTNIRENQTENAISDKTTSFIPNNNLNGNIKDTQKNERDGIIISKPNGVIDLTTTNHEIVEKEKRICTCDCQKNSKQDSDEIQDRKNENKSEPSITDLLGIVKMQNEQLQLLQSQVEKLIKLNESNTKRESDVKQVLRMQKDIDISCDEDEMSAKEEPKRNCKSKKEQKKVKRIAENDTKCYNSQEQIDARQNVKRKDVEINDNDEDIRDHLRRSHVRRENMKPRRIINKEKELKKQYDDNESKIDVKRNGMCRDKEVHQKHMEKQKQFDRKRYNQIKDRPKINTEMHKDEQVGTEDDFYDGTDYYHTAVNNKDKVKRNIVLYKDEQVGTSYNEDICKHYMRENIVRKTNSNEKISVGIMTSFEVSIKSPFDNTIPEGWKNCDSKESSVKNFVEDHTSNEQVFSDTWHMKNNDDECSLHLTEPLNIQEPPLSPNHTVHIDMQEYESDSEEETSSVNPGWTFYDNILGKVNNLLENSPSPGRENCKQKINIQNEKNPNDYFIDKINQTPTLQRDCYGGSRESNQVVGELKSNEISFAVKQLLMKYLPDERLANIANQQDGVRGDRISPDVSVATVRYLQQYNLIKSNSIKVKVQLVKGQNPRKTNNGKQIKSSLKKVPQSISENGKILDITTLKQQPKLL